MFWLVSLRTRDEPRTVEAIILRWAERAWRLATASGKAETDQSLEKSLMFWLVSLRTRDQPHTVEAIFSRWSERGLAAAVAPMKLDSSGLELAIRISRVDFILRLLWARRLKATAATRAPRSSRPPRDSGAAEVAFACAV